MDMPQVMIPFTIEGVTVSIGCVGELFEISVGKQHRKDFRNSQSDHNSDLNCFFLLMLTLTLLNNGLYQTHSLAASPPSGDPFPAESCRSAGSSGCESFPGYVAGMHY